VAASFETPRKSAAPQDDEEMMRKTRLKCRADVSQQWRRLRAYENLTQIRIKVMARRRSRSRRDFYDDGFGFE
jgi:hypothetical protein